MFILNSLYHALIVHKYFRHKKTQKSKSLEKKSTAEFTLALLFDFNSYFNERNLAWCFSRFLNCKNGRKLSKAFHKFINFEHLTK